MLSYLHQQLIRQSHILPKSFHEELWKEGEAMKEIGVIDAESHKDFLHIVRYAREVIEGIIGVRPKADLLGKVSKVMFEGRNEYPLGSIEDFTYATIKALNKIAYPVGGDLTIQYPYDLNKWLKTVQDIYQYVNIYNLTSEQAFDNLTQNWDVMEKNSFKNWMAFYEENAHLKYKTAQNYIYPTNTPVPVDILRPNPLPSLAPTPSLSPSEAKDLEIKKKIRAIISRLNAAERLATDPEVQRTLQKMLDVSLPEWLESLQKIKRLVQTAPLRAIAIYESMNVREISKVASDNLVQDLMIREALRFWIEGKKPQARAMYKLAQALPGVTPLPSGGNAPDQEGLPDNQNPDVKNDSGDQALKDMIKAMNPAENDFEDVSDIQDEEDPVEIHVIAQAVPQMQTQPEVPEMPMEEEPAEISVEEPDIVQPGQAQEVPQEPVLVQPESSLEETGGQDPFEAALGNIGIADVVSRLEALANIFRNREISRQLAIIDLMMDKLGIATFFPSLAEANSKSLESNQYALTRIEDILSRLRGTLETPHQVDLEGEKQLTEPVPLNVNTQNVKNNLSEEAQADRDRKEERKRQTNTQLDQAKNKPDQVPEVTNVEQDLAQPVAIQPPQAV